MMNILRLRAFLRSVILMMAVFACISAVAQTTTKAACYIPSTPITGGGSPICMTAVQPLSNATPGGVWTSDDPLTATVSSSGLVTGIAAGTTTIHYTITDLSGCTGDTTQLVTVNIRPLMHAVVNGVHIFDNNDGLDDSATVYVCNNPATNMIMTYIGDMNSYSMSLTIVRHFTLTNVTFTESDGTSGWWGYYYGIRFMHAQLINPLLPGEIIMSYTAFEDLNLNNIIDGNECTSDNLIFKVIVNRSFTTLASAGAGGTISPSGSVNICAGAPQEYYFRPSDCFHVADVIVDGVSVGAVNPYTIPYDTINHTIHAVFAIDTNIITVSPAAHGNISPGTATVNCGSNNTYTIIPDPCYHIVGVTLDGVPQGPVSSLHVDGVRSDHTIAASFALNTYTITVSAGAHGVIAPGAATVSCGSNNNYTITPDACYHIQDVTIDGISQGAVGAVNVNGVTANHTVAATFALDSYTISVSPGANGSISPATGTILCGSNNTYTITADPCYHILDVTIDGISQGAIAAVNVNSVTAPHTVAASFTPDTYMITVIPGANGSISPLTATVNCGSSNTYTITPDPCYHILDVTIDGISQGAVSTVNVNAVSANHIVAATFAVDIHIITLNPGIHGIINPVAGTVACGTTNTFTITPFACYHIIDVTLDAVSQGAVPSVTLINVTANHTIAAFYALDTYTITVNPGANGTITPGTGVVNCGSNNHYTITANTCYRILDVTVDGISQGAVSSLDIDNVTANHTIAATFIPDVYVITVLSTPYGTVSPGTGVVPCGSNPTYTMVPFNNYVILDVLVDGVSVGPVSSYTFINITGSHTINVIFGINIPYLITATHGSNGTISPPGVTSLSYGASQTYSITPSPCYHIVNVYVDGVPQGPVTSYTFTYVTADHSIIAAFASDIPAPPIVTGIVNVCSYIGTGVPVTYTFNSIGATGYSYLLPPAKVTLVSSTFNSVTVTFQTGFDAQPNKQIRVIALSGCGNSAVSIYYVAALQPATPSTINGTASVCAVIGTGATQTYSIPPVFGATSYAWITQSGTTTVTHPNGSGVNDTIVTVSFLNSFTSSPISVTAINGCGASSPRSFILSNIPPASPGLIAGPTNACEYMAPYGVPATYSVIAIPGLTSYNWTMPPGASGLAGAGTNTISFTYPNSFAAGSVTVTATNGCGTSPARSRSINKLSASIPGVIDVINTVGCPNREYTYSLATMPSQATSVIWTVPAGAIILSGQGTLILTVSYPATPVIGNVTVQAFNNCSNSTIRTTAVKLPACGAVGSKANNISAKSCEKNAAEALQVNVYPNPAIGNFNLRVLTNKTERINVRILDMQGRTLKQFTTTPQQLMVIGADLETGTYMIEVKQGAVQRTTKLIKL